MTRFFHSLIVACYIIVILQSCNINNIDYVRNFYDIYEHSSNRETIIIAYGKSLSDYINEFPISKLTNKYKDYNFYYCDGTSRNNVCIQYVFNISHFPIIIHLDKDGLIKNYTSDIATSEDLDDLLKSLSLSNNNSSDSENMCDVSVVNKYFKIRQLIDTQKDYTQAYEIFNSITSQNSTFYYDYLGYELCSYLGKLNQANIFHQKLLDYQTVDQAYIYLNLQIRKEHSSTEFPILVSDFEINIGEIHREDTITVDIPYYNMGNSSLVIMDIITSCECLNVDYPTLLEPNHKGLIRIKYHPSKYDTQGKFVKYLPIISNTEFGDEGYTLKGVLLN